MLKIKYMLLVLVVSCGVSCLAGGVIDPDGYGGYYTPNGHLDAVPAGGYYFNEKGKNGSDNPYYGLFIPNQ